MQLQFTSLSVVQTGKLLAMLYGFAALIMLPFVLIAILFGDAKAAAPFLVMMVLYPIIGFIGGMIMAAIYNFSANLAGLEVTVERVELE